MKKKAGLLGTLLVTAALAGCGGGGGGDGGPTQPPPPTTFSIGGTASDLAGSGLTLQNNGADSLAITGNGGFTFATEVNSGSSYNVTVATQPLSPTQTCTVTNGSGTASANVTNILVECVTTPPPATTFSIGGTASRVAGSGLTLQNGADSLAIAGNGPFTFGSEVNSGGSYNVTVAAQPANPTQTCTVTNGSGTATGDVTNVLVDCVTPSPSVDSDGDGLTDAEEAAIGTNWGDSDTDGDGYSDGNEMLSFDPSVNNFRFNPRVADVPEIRIEIQETPQIGANITEQGSSQQTISTTRAQSTSNTSSTTYGASTTLGIESSQSATVGASLQGPSAEISSTVKVNSEATVSFDSQTSMENREAWERMQANGIERSTTVSDGFVSVGVSVVNTGHLSLRVEALDILAQRVNDGDEPFVAVGTLTRDTDFSAIDLAAGDSINNLRFERTSVDLPTIRSLLTDTRSLKLEQGNVRIINTSDESVALEDEEITRRTAKIVIDYGPYAQTEFYRVSTNIIPGQPGRSLGELMSDTLRIPYNEDATELTTVRDVSSDTGRWVVTLKRIRDLGSEIETFDSEDPERVSYSLDDIDVRAFDEVLLVLLEDPDNDGIGYREELLHGTDPLSADTDSDGRTDYEEIRESWFVNATNVQDPSRYTDVEVTSSPTIADYDNDGLSDSEEFENQLDPYNADTDGDGLGDLEDSANDGEMSAVMPLQLGMDPNDPMATPFDVQTSGAISAASPQVVATASISWGDGAVSGPFETLSGQQSQTNIPRQTHTYSGPGDYQISLDANDDDSPVNTLAETAQVRLTAPEEAENDGLGYRGGYRIGIHVRKVLDLNQDGFDDLLFISNGDTRVRLGSENGLQPDLEAWATNEWIPDVYEGLETDPRLFADIDGDNDLDIVGVDASEGTVNYGINNGSGFDAPVEWLSGLNWNASRDQAFLADVDGNGFIDFVHASTTDRGVTTYTNSGGAALTLSEAGSTSLDLVDAFPGENNSLDSYPDRTRHVIEVKDLNNDGCADITLFGQSATYVAQSSCDGSFDAWSSPYNGFGIDQGYQVGFTPRWVEDMTGDGLPDFFVIGPGVTVLMVNTSTTQSISFDVSGRDTVETDFGSGGDNVIGWADNKTVDGRDSFGVYPRYLADVNNDGLKDIVGFGPRGASVALNQRVEGGYTFTERRILAPVFDVTSTSTDWYNDYECSSSAGCRDYALRIIGDINGDGRADLLGFSDRRLFYQEMPYVTQFE